jgi:integrase
MTYRKTLHNQLSALFNHAVKFYELKSNPAAKVGNMGSEKTKEIQFWTQEEYEIFIDAMRDKPMSYYAFSLMYWTGLRIGELLALTPKDFNFEKGTVSINKSYQRLQGKDIITEPKTPKSNRIIKITDTLCDEMQEYIRHQYKIKPKDRLFPTNKSYLTNEMIRGCRETGVKKITLHSIRHSHVSLLINLGFSAVAIADRVGHESIDITYRYAHLFPSKQIEMVDRLEELQNVSKKS